MIHDYYKKKLLYRSCYRGCKEIDLLLGSFAKLHLANFTIEELKEYENILNLNDYDLYDYLTKKQSIPHHLNNYLMHKLCCFIDEFFNS